MSFPDFSLIKFVPPGKRAKATAAGEKTSLYAFFDAVVNKHSLEIDEYQLDEIFIKDLAIDTKKYDKVLVGVLAEALIYFMTLWPGWERSSEYYSGKIDCKDWYEKFKNYLILKSTLIINKSGKYLNKKKPKTRTVEVQADLFEQNGGKRIAPYGLCVGGPPNVLNNVVFVETGGHIFIKQHLEKSWPELEIKEFLNWPYVTVEIRLPDIGIIRANTHQMPRYIALCNDTTVFPDVDSIKHIKRLPDSESKELKPYSYDFFCAYFAQLKETLKLIPEVHSERLLELETIFLEFLADIEEVNLYNKTMCPYLSVAYHIGKCKYIRNKRVSGGADKSTNEGINFYEIIIPEVDFSLNYFNVVQDNTDDESITFESLNKLKNRIKDLPECDEIKALRDDINSKCVKYNCTLCNEQFSGHYAYNKLNEHFRTHHKCEQTLLCQKCRKQFEVQYLTSKRWHHSCVR